MRITVRFFAILKERAGVSESVIELPEQASIAMAGKVVGEKFPALSNDLHRIAFAVNRSYAQADAILRDGDELALIPPVSGGSL